jgi:hypothetical protein
VFFESVSFLVIHFSSFLNQNMRMGESSLNRPLSPNRRAGLGYWNFAFLHEAENQNKNGKNGKEETPYLPEP